MPDLRRDQRYRGRDVEAAGAVAAGAARVRERVGRARERDRGVTERHRRAGDFFRRLAPRLERGDQRRDFELAILTLDEVLERGAGFFAGEVPAAERVQQGRDAHQLDSRAQAHTFSIRRAALRCKYRLGMKLDPEQRVPSMLHGHDQ